MFKKIVAGIASLVLISTPLLASEWSSGRTDKYTFITASSQDGEHDFGLRCNTASTEFEALIFSRLAGDADFQNALADGTEFRILIAADTVTEEGIVELPAFVAVSENRRVVFVAGVGHAPEQFSKLVDVLMSAQHKITMAVMYAAKDNVKDVKTFLINEFPVEKAGGLTKALVNVCFGIEAKPTTDG